MKNAPIYFFKEDVRFRFSKQKEIRAWLVSVLKKNSCNPANINFIFCSNHYLRRFNKEYLKHNYNTDIITFDNSSVKKEIEGDIYISTETVSSNAKKYAVSFNDELHRVMVHGILHLLGHTDKTKKEKAEMRKREDFWLEKRSF